MKINGMTRGTMVLSSTLFLFSLSAVSGGNPSKTESGKTATTAPAPAPQSAAPSLPPSKPASAVESQDQENLYLLSRELAKSSDQVFGTKKKGLCGKTADEVSQLLQALRAELDERKLDVTSAEAVLKKHKTCDSDCHKKLCASDTFKKLDKEKANYGTAKDGT